VNITHVFETHIHNDYVTGGLALARATDAAYHINADDDVAYDRSPIRDGDVIQVSPTMRVRAIATPGHTFTHLSYALEAAADSGQFEAVGVFTGGSLLFGATGRPDLLGEEHTHDLVHHQFASAHRLAEELPEQAQVLPTHGFGSFCSSGPTSGATASTIGAEQRQNPALTHDEKRWVADTLAGLDAYPAYYAHMEPANSAGPGAPDLSAPQAADKDALAARIAAGEWVIDLRTRTAFAAGHVTGTLNFGLDGQFSTYLGWLIPWGTPLTLLGESPEQVAEAQRELVRIGIDHLQGAAAGGPEEWTDNPLGTLERAVFADLTQLRHHRQVPVLDVRQVSEYDDGPHRGCPQHPAARAPRPPPRGPRRPGVGALRQRLPRHHRRVRPRRAPSAGRRHQRQLRRARRRRRPAHHQRPLTPCLPRTTTKPFRRRTTMCRPATCKTCGKTTWGRLRPARRPGHSRPPPRRPLPRPPQGPQLLRRLVPDPPVQPQLMTGSLLGVNRGRNTSPVMPSITAARTDRGCTSRPTLVRSVNTGGAHTCRRCRTDLCSVTHSLIETIPGILDLLAPDRPRGRRHARPVRRCRCNSARSWPRRWTNNAW